MKKDLLQYRTTFGLSAILLLLALILGSHYGLLPLATWAEHIVTRTPVNVTAVPIGIINKPVPIAGTGSIESPTSVPITTEFSGSISDVYVTEGQRVKAGEPLVKLLGSADSSQNTGNSAPTNQNSATNQQDQTSYDNALKEYNRDQKLYEQGAIPRRQVDNSAARLQALQQSSTNTQDTMQPSRSTASARPNGPTTINAPINGTVTALSTGVEKAVQGGQQLMVLDSGEVQVVIPIEQKDLYLVQLGTPATIEVSGQTMLGQVVSIYPEIGINNIPSFRTHIKVTNDTGGLLKTGMTVNVHINTGKSATVLAIPKVAVFQDNQGLNYIYLALNGKAIRQQITVVEPIGDLIEITANLPGEAMVITSSVNDLKDGDPIVILE